MMSHASLLSTWLFSRTWTSSLCPPRVKSSLVKVGTTWVPANMKACVTPQLPFPLMRQHYFSARSKPRFPQLHFHYNPWSGAHPRIEDSHWRLHICPFSLTWIYYSSRHPRLDQLMLSVGTSTPLSCLPLAAFISRSPSHGAWLHPVLLSPSSSTYVSAFPRFASTMDFDLCRLHQAGHGRGMLLHRGVWTNPSPTIRVVAMGYPLSVLCSTTLYDDVRSALLGQSDDSDICKWLVDVFSSFASDDYALINSFSFSDAWVFDTGATTHMTAHFTDLTDFCSVPRRWVNGLCCW
jgi:hypothetical protein